MSGVQGSSGLIRSTDNGNGIEMNGAPGSAANQNGLTVKSQNDGIDGSGIEAANNALAFAAALANDIVKSTGLSITVPPNAGLTGAISNGRIDPKFILVTPVTGDADSLKAGTISSSTISKVASKFGRVTTVVSVFMAGAGNFSNAEQLGGLGVATAFTAADVVVIVALGSTGVGGVVAGIAFGAAGGSAGVTGLVQRNLIQPAGSGFRRTTEALQDPQPLFKRIFFPRVPDMKGIGQ